MCECCEVGHNISSSQPRVSCGLCHHDYKKSDGSLIYVNHDELVRTIDGRKTRWEELIENLKMYMEVLDTDATFEVASGNIQYGQALDRCHDALEEILKKYEEFSR